MLPCVIIGADRKLFSICCHCCQKRLIHWNENFSQEPSIPSESAVSGKSPTCPIKCNVPVMMADSSSNAWPTCFPQKTVSPISQEYFVYPVLHCGVLLVECALENVHELECLLPISPCLVTLGTESLILWYLPVSFSDMTCWKKGTISKSWARSSPLAIS